MNLQKTPFLVVVYRQNLTLPSWQAVLTRPPPNLLPMTIGALLQACRQSKEAFCDPQEEKQVPQEALQDPPKSLQQPTKVS